MTEYWFGSSIIRNFWPIQDGEPYPLPTQNPSIYLFSSQPSAEAALSGDGAFQTKTTWTQASVEPYKCTYSLDPIPPPASGATQTLGFWESIKLVAASGGQAQAVTRYFEVSKPSGTATDPETGRNDITGVYPGILSYLREDQLDTFLADAREELKLDLEARGLTWARLGELNKLRLALAYKAISLASFSQFQTLNDRHYVRWKQYAEKCKALLDTVNVTNDVDGDGQQDQAIKPSFTHQVILK